MRGFLLDTNVVSELRRPAPAPTVRAFVSGQPQDFLFISEVVFAEIRFGIEEQASPQRRAELRAWLDQSLRPFFAGRALAVTEDVVLRWRLLLDAGRRRGHTFGQVDLLLAATAAEADLVVVSRDTAHFVAAAVPTLDPWTGRYANAAGGETTVAGLDSRDLLGRLPRGVG